MWLIAGLGNPGSRYESTPHNFGFAVALKLAERHRLSFSASRQAQGEVATGKIAGHDVTLMMPTTFMNLSGEAVSAYARYYKIEPANIVTITDEVQLAWGKIRLRASGSHGGHNGIRNVIQHLGTDQFPRIRIGCAPENWKGDLASYVLAKLRGDALDLACHMVEITADAVEVILKHGFDKAQARFNGYDAMKVD